MWHYKENEEDEDIWMAAAGFMFLTSQVSRQKKQKAFLGEANIGQTNNI
jgi:hypothetical protein